MGRQINYFLVRIRVRDYPLGWEGIAAKPLLLRQYNSVGRDLSSLYGQDFKEE